MAAADIPALMGNLSTLAAALEARGIDAARERSTLFTAEQFVVAIAADRNETHLAAVFSAWLACAPSNASCAATAQALAAALPDLEESELSGALSAAVSTALAVLAAPGVRPPAPVFNASTLRLVDGYFRTPDGSPRIVSGFNDMDAALLAPGGAAVRALSIGATDQGIGFKDLLPNGTVTRVEGLLQALDAAAAGGYQIEIAVSQGSVAPWMLQQWPDIANSTNKFVGYDIDHPAAREQMYLLLNGYAAALAAAPQQAQFISSWNLANEPYFPNASSVHSQASYRAFLDAAYGGNISALNAGWGASFASFADIGWLSLQATNRWRQLQPAERADFAAWNNARVVAWAKNMRDAIVAALPAAATHIKLINEMWAWDIQPHNLGLDREALAALLDVAGCDTRIPSPPANVPGWRGQCPAQTPPAGAPQPAMSWVEPAMSYDLQRSLAPGKAIVDSEWHMASDDGFYVPGIPAGHAAAGLWLAALSGLSSTLTWYWARAGGVAPAGSAATAVWFPYSLLTQPQLLDAMARAHLDVNALAPLLPPLVAAAGAGGVRPLSLLYSEAAAVHDDGYLCGQVAAYEAAAGVGLPVGFVTDATLTASGGGGGEGSLSASAAAGPFCAPLLQAGGAPAPTLLLLPAVSYASDATAGCVRAFLAAGGAALVLDAPAAANGTTLRFGPRGERRPDAALAWLDAGAVHASPAPAAALLPVVEAAAFGRASLARRVRCVDAAAGGGNATAAGVWCRATLCDAAGAPPTDGPLPPHLRAPALPPCAAVLFAVNMRSAAAQLAVQLDGTPVPRALQLLTNTTVALGAAGAAVPPLAVLVWLLPPPAA